MTEANVQQAVPFFAVSDMDASLHYYVDGLGFKMTNQWTPEGKIRWCWLQLGGAAIMLQTGKPAPGVSVAFQCRDALALYREFRSRGIEAKTPFVGNSMWVVVLTDPDGYKLDFESATNVAEETVYSEATSSLR